MAYVDHGLRSSSTNQTPPGPTTDTTSRRRLRWMASNDLPHRLWWPPSSGTSAPRSRIRCWTISTTISRCSTRTAVASLPRSPRGSEARRFTHRAPCSSRRANCSGNDSNTHRLRVVVQSGLMTSLIRYAGTHSLRTAAQSAALIQHPLLRQSARGHDRGHGRGHGTKRAPRVGGPGTKRAPRVGKPMMLKRARTAQSLLTPKPATP